MKEIWADVLGYDNPYEVSNLGNVRSKNHPERYLYQRINCEGYVFVKLTKNGKRQNKTVHRIVANAFLPNPDGLPQINHKDEDKANNRADNLEWCSGYYNIHYGSCLDKISLGVSKPVYQMSLSGELIERHFSVTGAGRKLGIYPSTISACCKNERYTAGGYKWAYAPKATT